MAQLPSDPSRWLAELMESAKTPWWPADQATEVGQAFAAALAPWTKAVADVANWQLQAFNAMAAPWLSAMPGAKEKITDRRFSGDAWQNDPRYEALARTYLAQSEM